MPDARAKTSIVTIAVVLALSASIESTARCFGPASLSGRSSRSASTVPNSRICTVPLLRGDPTPAGGGFYRLSTAMARRSTGLLPRAANVDLER